MIEISERVFSYGQSEFIRNVSIPVCSEVEKIAKKYPREQDDDNLNLHSNPTASGTELSALIGIVAFFGTWAATKFLDEIYNATFAPIVKEKLNSFIKDTNQTKKYALSISLNKKNKKNSILICCVGTTIEEISESEKYISNVLEVSENYIDSSNDGSVFLFVIENGKYNLAPSIHNNYDNALHGLKKLYPIKPPMYVKKDRS